MELRPYQQAAIDSILSAEKNGITKQLIVIPTGGGKTVIFASIPKIRDNSLPMLVLAHREELLTQAKDKLLAINPDLKIEIEQGENHASTGCDVVVASVPTIGRANSTRINKFDPKYFRTIVIDEAHHSAASTYKNVLEHFQPELLVGVTATPQRGDNVRLTDVFEEVTYYITIEELIRDGYLCNLSGYRVRSDSDITGVSTNAGDYAAGELEEAVNIHERNELIVRAYKELAGDRKTIVFCAGVQHAYDLAAEFFKAGIPSQALVGETTPERRQKVLNSFHTGETRILTNVGVLTEGFDEPSVECIIFARPTRSNLLYTQCVGRGTRLFEGKYTCLVIDIADISKGKKPLGLPTLLGLPPDFDLDGGDLLEAAEAFSDLEKKAPAAAAGASSLTDIELAWERIDLFAAPKASAAVLEHSALIWSEISDGNYYLNINNEESLHMTSTPLGQYRVTISRGKEERELGLVDTLREAFSRSDNWVKKNRAANLKLLDANEIWRKDPPTDKQVKWLKKFGVIITTDMTKGEASLILDKYFKENPPKPKSSRQQWAIQNAKNKKLF